MWQAENPVPTVPDAEKEVRFRRFQSQFDPARWPDLAGALADLVSALVAEHRAEEALAAALEATELRKRYPSRPNPRGAGIAHAAHAKALAALGRPAEALAAATDAVALFRSRSVVGKRGPAGEPVPELYRLARWLAEQGEHTLARAAVEHNVALSRALAEQAFWSDGARQVDALEELARVLTAGPAGGTDAVSTDAVSTVTEAVDTARKLLHGTDRPAEPKLMEHCAAALERYAVVIDAGTADRGQLVAAAVAARQSAALTEAVAARQLWRSQFEPGDLTRRRRLSDDLTARAGALPAPLDWETATGVTVRLGLQGYTDDDPDAAERLAVAVVGSGRTDALREVIFDPAGTPVGVLLAERDPDSGRARTLRLAPADATPVLADVERLRRKHGLSVSLPWTTAEHWTIGQQQVQAWLSEPEGPTSIPGPGGTVRLGSAQSEQLSWYFYAEDFGGEGVTPTATTKFVRGSADPRRDAIDAFYRLSYTHNLAVTIR